jgi:hypothetical protein
MAALVTMQPAVTVSIAAQPSMQAHLLVEPIGMQPAITASGVASVDPVNSDLQSLSITIPAAV